MIPLIGEARITNNILDNHARLNAMIFQMEQHFVPQQMEVESAPKNAEETQPKSDMGTEIETKGEEKSSL